MSQTGDMDLDLGYVSLQMDEEDSSGEGALSASVFGESCSLLTLSFFNELLPTALCVMKGEHLAKADFLKELRQLTRELYEL